MWHYGAMLETGAGDTLLIAFQIKRRLNVFLAVDFCKLLKTVTLNSRHVRVKLPLVGHKHRRYTVNSLQD